MVRRFYPDDPVTRLLLEEPIPITWSRVRALGKLLWDSLIGERLSVLPWFLPRRPSGIAIEITNACNLRCTMCNLVTMQRPPRLMAMDVFITIADRCAEARIPSVRLHTYGETLLHPRLPEMLAYARGRGLRVWISTNGQLLDEERARAILSAGVACVRFSVEGGTAPTYETIRVGGQWDVLIENVRRFRQLRDALSPSTAIGLNTVLMRDTLAEIDLLQQVFGTYVDEIEISALEGLGSAGAKLSQDQWLERHDLDRRRPCRLLWDMLNVSVDGIATLCCADVEAEIVVGNALDQSLLEIWRGAALERIRQLHRERRFDKVSICSSCSFGVTNTALNRYRYALLNDRRSFGGRVR